MPIYECNICNYKTKLMSIGAILKLKNTQQPIKQKKTIMVDESATEKEPKKNSNYTFSHKKEPKKNPKEPRTQNL